MADILLTLPKTITWDAYCQELLAVQHGESVLNFRLPTLPRACEIGDRCWLAHKGKLLGWMSISGVLVREAFVCSTTSQQWPAGPYLQRVGKFHFLKPKQQLNVASLQGYRYLKDYPPNVQLPAKPQLYEVGDGWWFCHEPQRRADSGLVGTGQTLETALADWSFKVDPDF